MAAIVVPGLTKHFETLVAVDDLSVEVEVGTTVTETFW